MTTNPPAPSGVRRPNTALRIGIIAIVALAIAGGAGIWFLFFRGGEPAPVNLANVPLASASSAPGASAAAPAATAGAGTGTAPTSFDGTWTVDTSLGTGDTGTFVGYRVQEELARIGAATAVGRTASVTGTFTLAGATVTAASFKADLSTLKSDSDQRDNQIKRIGLELSKFPEASFELSGPIDLGTLPADGVVATVDAKGKLTVHGVTKEVTIPLQVKRSAAVVAIAGSVAVTFADFGMEKPITMMALSVADPAIIEFQLLFSKQ